MKTKTYLIPLFVLFLFISACTPRLSLGLVGQSGKAALIEALRAGGAEVEAGDAFEQPFFSTPAQVFQVNGQDIQVFEYDSAAEMEAEAALVSPDGGSVGANSMFWLASPHFFKFERLIVLYVGDDAAMLDLLTGALGQAFAGN